MGHYLPPFNMRVITESNTSRISLLVSVLSAAFNRRFACSKYFMSLYLAIDGEKSPMALIISPSIAPPKIYTIPSASFKLLSRAFGKTPL